MHPVAVPVELLAPGVLFAAGGFYFATRAALTALRQDVNGVGRKLGELKDGAQTERYRAAVILLATCPEDQREWIATKLLR